MIELHIQPSLSSFPPPFLPAPLLSAYGYGCTVWVHGVHVAVRRQLTGVGLHLLPPYMYYRDQTQAVRLGGKHFYNQVILLPSDHDFLTQGLMMYLRLASTFQSPTLYPNVRFISRCHHIWIVKPFDFLIREVGLSKPIPAAKGEALSPFWLTKFWGCWQGSVVECCWVSAHLFIRQSGSLVLCSVSVITPSSY